jgi:sulfite reductase (NADPH) hemoprotein beta-component
VVRKRVITANRLIDGAVVWRDDAGSWLEDFDRAATNDDDRTVGRMLADARADATAGLVIAPYEVDVDVLVSAVSPAIMPTRLRERIRAFGPTVAPR